MSYQAFISYSHQESASGARKLHQALVRFATPWYRRRRMRLFLDDANLPATPSLWRSIEQALSASQYFIFLASPAAAASVWCNQEISYWLEHKPKENIILVLISGTIQWDREANDFKWAETTAIPEVLKGVFTDEPYHIDLRKLDPAVSTKETAFSQKLAEIASVLLDTPKDDLIGEDLRLHQRALQLAVAVILVLLITSILALWQWRQATVQRDLARQRLSQAIDISEKMLFDIDEKLTGVAGAGDLRRTLTYDALSLLIELRKEAVGHEDLQWAQMTAYYQKGNLAMRYGDLDEAEEAFLKSEQIADMMVKKRPEFIEPYHSWALSYHALGKVRSQQHRFAEAYDAFDRAKQLVDFILEDSKDDEDALLLSLNIYQDWGDAAYENREFSVAHKNYKAGIELSERLAEENPEDAEYLYLYSLMLDRKARYFPIHENPMALLDVREQAADILKRLVKEFPDVTKYRLNLAVAYEKLGDVAFEVKNLEGASSYYSHAVFNVQALYTAEPINNLYKKMLAVDYGKRGQCFVQLGDYDNAMDLFEQEYAWLQALVSVDPENRDYEIFFILAHQHLADLNAKTGNITECKKYYQKAIERALSFLNKDRRNKQSNLLLAAMRVDYANFLVDVDSEASHDLIIRTTDHLEAWLQEYPRQEEGWLYLVQSRTNEYLITKLSGDTKTAEIIRDQVLKTIAGMSKDSRKKYAMEIDTLMKKLQF